MTRLEACLPRREDARATIGAGLSYPRAHRPCRFLAHHGPLPAGGTPTPHHQRPLREPGTPWGAQASRLSRRASRPVPEHWSSEHGNIVNGQFAEIKKEDEPQSPQRSQSFPGRQRAFSIRMDSRPLAFIRSPSPAVGQTARSTSHIPPTRASFLRSLRSLWFIHNQRVMLLNRPWTENTRMDALQKPPHRPFFIWMDS